MTKAPATRRTRRTTRAAALTPAAGTRRPVPHVAARSALAADLASPGRMAAGALAGLPAFAVSAAPSRVRATGRARDAQTPVILERDRRDPRRHGTATLIDTTSASIEGVVVAVGANEAEAGDDQYSADVAA